LEMGGLVYLRFWSIWFRNLLKDHLEHSENV
jgi:hypothetical protein